MFVATTKEGIQLLSNDSPKVLELYRDDMYCPITTALLYFRNESKTGTRAHFAIHPSCTDEQKEAHSVAYKNTTIHDACVIAVVDYLLSHGHKRSEIKLEKYLPKGDTAGSQRADIHLSREKGDLYFEVQKTPIRRDEYERRTNLYRAKGKDVIWVVKDDILKGGLITEYLKEDFKAYGIFTSKKKALAVNREADITLLFNSF